MRIAWKDYIGELLGAPDVATILGGSTLGRELAPEPVATTRAPSPHTCTVSTPWLLTPSGAFECAGCSAMWQEWEAEYPPPGPARHRLDLNQPTPYISRDGRLGLPLRVAPRFRWWDEAESTRMTRCEVILEVSRGADRKPHEIYCKDGPCLFGRVAPLSAEDKEWLACDQKPPSKASEVLSLLTLARAEGCYQFKVISPSTPAPPEDCPWSTSGDLAWRWWSRGGQPAPEPLVRLLEYAVTNLGAEIREFVASRPQGWTHRFFKWEDDGQPAGYA